MRRWSSTRSFLTLFNHQRIHFLQLNIPELYTSDECNEDQVKKVQNLIGVINWIIDLVRIYIAFEVSSLSKFMSNPRTGHLIQELHVFKYL